MKKLFLSIMIVLMLLNSQAVLVYADSATAYTYFISTQQQWSKTQDAYVVGEVLFADLELSEPSDMVFHNGFLYICDTGNARVLKIRDGSVMYIYESNLSIPTGISLDNNDNLYIADNSGKVIKMSPNGELLLKITRPEDFAFGIKNSFKPQKVAVDNNGSIYVISEGSFDGLMQFSAEGDFLGYYAANKTKVKFWEGIQRLIMSPERVAKMFNIIPKSLANVAVDKDGLVYTVTQSADKNALKKHSVSGTNILQASADGSMVIESNFTDLVIGSRGQIYAVSETGVIYEYDESGRLLFAFGGRATTSERAGLLTVASAITADESDNIYVLDKERGLVHHFVPTAFADLYHNAIGLFNSGRYEESSHVWHEVLRLDAMSQRAHYGLGMVYYNQMNYQKAADSFKIANTREEYSDAFWEIRDKTIQQNIGWLILALIGIWFLLKLIRYVLRLRARPNLHLIKRMLLHPIDALYDIKYSVTSKAATIIYIVIFVVFVFQMAGMGYLFRDIFASYITPVYLLVLFIVPLGLWILGNYLVSTINDGEGSLKQIYCGTAFSFTPYFLFTPLVILASWVLTYNESFLIDIALVVISAWTLLNLFLMVREIHSYNTVETVKIIGITLFFMLVAAVAFSIFYIFMDKVISFIYGIGLEVFQRVNNKI